jgi:hypothetical protein
MKDANLIRFLDRVPSAGRFSFSRHGKKEPRLVDSEEGFLALLDKCKSPLGYTIG